MLSRSAAKAVNGRSILLAARPTATRSWIRSYAKDEHPHRAPAKRSPISDIDSSAQDVKGPVQNRTWSPAKGISFSKSPSDVSTDYSSLQPEFDTAATSQTIKQGSSQDGPGQPVQTSDRPIAASAPGSSRTRKNDVESDFSTSQPEFETVASTEGGKAASSKPSAPKEPATPLPDLRQGLPSTFDAEFLKRPTSTSGESSTGLNLTEDPNSTAEEPRGSGELPKSAYVSSIDRRRNFLARMAAISMVSFGLVGVLYLGRDWDDEYEARLHADVPRGWSPMAMYERAQVRMSKSLGYYTEPAFPKLLPDVDPAMRPPYTLVLSLEDLLVTSKWSRTKGWEVAKRPGVDYFLRYLSQYYELVIFTSVQMMNADLVIRKLDPYHIVMWPLFREATRYMNGAHVKDLSYLNRPLNKTLIVDTMSEHTQLQPENAIILPKWKGEPGDQHAPDLVALVPFLEYIANMSVEDVRKVLATYEGKHIPTEFAAREAKAREAFNKQLAEEKAKRPRVSSGLGSIGKALGFKAAPSMMSIPGEPTAAEALAQGKMLSDQMRERGRKNYEQVEKEIRENGAKWLEEMAREEKKAQEEQMKSVQGGVSGFLGGLVGGGGPGGSTAA